MQIRYHETDPDLVGLAGLAEDGDPADLGELVEDFGAHSAALGEYGIEDGSRCPVPLLGEVYPVDGLGDWGLSPIYEVGLADYAALQESGPYPGMLALGLDGIYQWDNSDGLGRFKRLRRLRRRIRGALKRVIKRLPGGKALVKIGGRVRKIAARAVRAISKAAPAIARVAAIVPGYGPVIAAGVRAAGRVASAAQRLGAVAPPRQPVRLPGGPQTWLALRRELARHARGMARENQRDRAARVGRRVDPASRVSLHGFEELGI